jgi:hypothetical protein
MDGIVTIVSARSDNAHQFLTRFELEKFIDQMQAKFQPRLIDGFIFSIDNFMRLWLYLL